MRPQDIETLREEREDEAGFSLLELMVVIVILGILATIVVINVMPSTDRAAVTRAQTDIRTLSNAVRLYQLETRRYPTTDEGLEILAEIPEGGFREEPFLEGGLPADPWGNPYQYLYPGERGTFDLYSLGRDGRPGGEGLDADIGNWAE